MCYFTMATETRFIDSNLKMLSNQNPAQQDSIIKDESTDSTTKKQPFNMGNMKIMKKYGYP